MKKFIFYYILIFVVGIIIGFIMGNKANNLSNNGSNNDSIKEKIVYIEKKKDSIKHEIDTVIKYKERIKIEYIKKKNSFDTLSVDSNKVILNEFINRYDSCITDTSSVKKKIVALNKISLEREYLIESSKCLENIISLKDSIIKQDSIELKNYNTVVENQTKDYNNLQKKYKRQKFFTKGVGAVGLVVIIILLI